MTLKLWNFVDTCGPWNLFDLRMRTCNEGKDPNQNGNVSLILLLLTFKSSRRVQWTKDFGSSPSRWLRLTSSDINLVALTNISGIIPVKLLLRRTKSVREAVEFFRHWGIEPLNRLLDKFKISSDVRLQIQWGNGPRKALELRSNHLIACVSSRACDDDVPKLLKELLPSATMVNLHIQLGTSPSMLLLVRQKYSSFNNFDRDFGIDPLRLLKLRCNSSRLWYRDISFGIGPSRLFWARFRNWSLDDEDIFQNLIGPLKWFLSRLTYIKEVIVNKEVGNDPVNVAHSCQEAWSPRNYYEGWVHIVLLNWQRRKE